MEACRTGNRRCQRGTRAGLGGRRWPDPTARGDEADRQREACGKWSPRFHRRRLDRNGSRAATASKTGLRSPQRCLSGLRTRCASANRYREGDSRPHTRFVFKHGPDLRRANRLAQRTKTTASRSSAQHRPRGWQLTRRLDRSVANGRHSSRKPTQTETDQLWQCAEIAVKPVRLGEHGGDRRARELAGWSSPIGCRRERDAGKVEGACVQLRFGPPGSRNRSTSFWSATYLSRPVAAKTVVPFPRFPGDGARSTVMTVSEGWSCGMTRGWEETNPPRGVRR